MDKIIFCDYLGRLSENPKAGIMLMVGKQKDFTVNLEKGIVKHKSGKTFKIEKVNTWSAFTEEISIAEADLNPLPGTNIAPAAMPSKLGAGMAVVRNGVVVASILFSMAPNDPKWTYTKWKQLIVDELSKIQGETCYGVFDENGFQQHGTINK